MSEPSKIQLCLHKSYDSSIYGKISEISGVRYANEEEIDQEFYHAKALIPKFESCILKTNIDQYTNKLALFHETVGLFKLPTELIKVSSKIISNLNKYPKNLVVQNLQRHLVNEKILTFLMNTFPLDSKNLEDIGFSCSAPSFKTITINRRLGVKEGMHFDT